MSVSECGDLGSFASSISVFIDLMNSMKKAGRAAACRTKKLATRQRKRRQAYLFRRCRQGKCIVSLALNARNCLNGVKHVVSLSGVFDVGVDEGGVDSFAKS